METRILSIDPSGTGTTGIFFKHGAKELFHQFQNKDWKEHYAFIRELTKEKQPTLLLYEDTNYIHKKTKDGLSLFRLLGAIEFLEVARIESINVLRVKELYRKILEGKEQIKNLIYTGQGRGHGWLWKGERISIHQLDALLIYYLFNN